MGSYVGNRQDALEAVQIAASGKVKVFYKLKGLGDLERYDTVASSRLRPAQRVLFLVYTSPLVKER